MAPAVVSVAAMSLLVWTGKWYLDELSGLADRVGALALFVIAWGVWPGLGAVFLYRTVTFTYRLTDRAVLIDFGLWYPPVPPVLLTEIQEVRTGAGWFSRLLGVGWVELTIATGTVRMTGVRHPEAFAEQIRAAARQETRVQKASAE